MNYCVMRIDSGEVVYKGYSAAGAAVKLEPGTVHGKGVDSFDAHFRANTVRKKILSARAKAKKAKHKEARP